MSDNPPAVWPPDIGIETFSGTWWVAHTKSRNEKALAWQLQKKNVSYFLPMAEKVSKRNRRISRSMLPLFSGYVFFCGNENDRLEALKTNRISNIIQITDQKLFINELMPIEKALVGGADLQSCAYIQSGQRCRVLAGPLMGIEGIAVNEQNKTRLVLQVDILGKATCLDIEANLLEVIEQ